MRRRNQRRRSPKPQPPPPRSRQARLQPSLRQERPLAASVHRNDGNGHCDDRQKRERSKNPMSHRAPCQEHTSRDYRGYTGREIMYEAVTSVVGICTGGTSVCQACRRSETAYRLHFASAIGVVSLLPTWWRVLGFTFRQGTIAIIGVLRADRASRARGEGPPARHMHGALFLACAPLTSWQHFLGLAIEDAIDHRPAFGGCSGGKSAGR